MIVAATVIAAAEEAPKFTSDQCKVMRQVGIDTKDMCPPPPPPPKKREKK